MSRTTYAIEDSRPYDEDELREKLRAHRNEHGEEATLALAVYEMTEGVRAGRRVDIGQRAEKLRERREAAQAFADGELQAVLAAALHELEELLHSDDPHVKLKAAVVILDRTLGRPGQRLEHAGTLELRRADLLAQAKEELQHEYNAQAVSARAKLQQLLERRTQVN